VSDKRRLVFLFPGQGSQKVGMGHDLAEAYPEQAGAVYRQADETLGFSVSRLCFEGPEQELVKTENTQPAVLVTSVATLNVLTSQGVNPSAVAGHSVGEFAALIAAQSISFEDALPLVRRRGELMASASVSAPGTMAAVIGLSVEQVEEICRSSGNAGTVEPSNLNAPKQIVISGETGALEIAAQKAEDCGARVIRLNVSAPFHCSLMAPVRDEFADALSNISIASPTIPIVSNTTGDYARTADEVRVALLDQLSSPVRWTESMLRLRRDGYDQFVEVGPGRVLAGLMRSTDRAASCTSVGSPRDVEDLVSREQG
jgi:[acyl-carrier-protein] S-malonyltransferase